MGSDITQSRRVRRENREGKGFCFLIFYASQRSQVFTAFRDVTLKAENREFVSNFDF